MSTPSSDYYDLAKVKNYIRYYITEAGDFEIAYNTHDAYVDTKVRVMTPDCTLTYEQVTHCCDKCRGRMPPLPYDDCYNEHYNSCEHTHDHCHYWEHHQHQECCYGDYECCQDCREEGRDPYYSSSELCRSASPQAP
ncbi:hypothetical protein JCM5296_005622 [Sporobolomyces johnsonii]